MDMVIFLTPAQDEVFDLERKRMAGHTVSVFVMDQERLIAQARQLRQALHMLTSRANITLVLPDDYHRHNELIERVKQCAIQAGIPVMPLTRYLRNAPPAPAPVHAQPEGAGVG